MRTETNPDSVEVVIAVLHELVGSNVLLGLFYPRWVDELALASALPDTALRAQKVDVLTASANKSELKTKGVRESELIVDHISDYHEVSTTKL